MAKSKPRPGDQIPDLIESLLAELGEDPDRQGLRATPERVSRALRQLTDGYGVKPEDVVKDAVFDQDYDEMVVVKGRLLHLLAQAFEIAALTRLQNLGDHLCDAGPNSLEGSQLVGAVE